MSQNHTNDIIDIDVICIIDWVPIIKIKYNFLNKQFFLLQMN